MTEDRRCPDDGRCWHECTAVGKGCFRVFCAGPLSGVYTEDMWPANVVIQELALGRHGMEGM